jgi:hypothetical protein
MRRPAAALPMDTQDQAAVQAILAGASRRGNPATSSRHPRHPHDLEPAFGGGILAT